MFSLNFTPSEILSYEKQCQVCHIDKLTVVMITISDSFYEVHNFSQLSVEHSLVNFCLPSTVIFHSHNNILREACVSRLSPGPLVCVCSVGIGAQ